MTSCIAPTGLGGAGQIPFNLVSDTLTSSGDPYLFYPLLGPVMEKLTASIYEGPIQHRIGAAHGNNVYNTVAMYHDTALDIWGRDERRICSTGTAQEMEAHAQIAVTYAYAYSAMSLVPVAEEVVTGIMDTLGLPMSNILNEATVNADPGTPWAVARSFVDEMTEYLKSDGWNADGSLTHDYNKMPYKDFDFEDANGNVYTAYQPKHPKMLKKNGKDICKKLKSEGKHKWTWQPLLESNGFGYFTKQEHVTPFCGYTGRLYGLSIEEYESFQAPEPDYNYCYESDYALINTGNLAGSDRMKMEVEYFDSKFTSIFAMQLDWGARTGLSLYEFWMYYMTMTNALYTAVMLVWREKVYYDLVRPPTVVHAVEGENKVKTFPGPFMGDAKSIPGKDWQPYIRTMPHAEYPSGSSCVCTTFSETLNALTGMDATTIPLGKTFPAGSSILEPGLTPASDLRLEYTSWSEMKGICQASRVNGGMHFSQAVPAAEELCTGVGSKLVEKSTKLMVGNTDGAMADYNDREIHVKAPYLIDSDGKKKKKAPKYLR